MLANGFDWIHVLLSLVLPGIANMLLMIGGLFYLIWFPLLGRNLLRLGQRVVIEEP
jgi:hypothetical protein